MDLNEQKQKDEQLRQNDQYAGGIVNSSIEGIDRKQSEIELQKTKDLLARTNRIARIGGWEVDLISGRHTWTDVMCEMHEVSYDFIPDTEQALNFCKDDKTRDTLKNLHSRAIEKGESFDIEFQIITAKGKELWARLIGQAEFAGDNAVRLYGTFQDIDADKKNRLKIEESEANLKEAQIMAKLGRWEFSLVTGQVKWSDSLFEIFEIEKEQFEATYEAFLNAIHPDDRQLVNDVYTRSVETRQPYEIEHRLQLADGRIKHLKASGRTEYDENGKPLRSIGISQEVTKQKQVEETLRENQARFEMALVAGNQGAWLFDWKTDTNFVDERWAAMLGYSLEEVGQTLNFWESRVHPDDLKKLYYVFERHDRGEIPMIDVDVRARTKNGEWKWFSDRAQILKRMPNGKPWIMAGTISDITERKQSEIERQLITVRLNLATKAANVGIWDYNIIKNQLIWDEQMFALYGITRETVTGVYEAWRAGLHPDDLERLDSETELALKGEKEYDTEFRVVWSDGSIHHIRALGKVIRDDEGNALRVVGTNWDITEQKRVEEELIEAKEKAEESETKLKASERRLRAIIATEPECVKLVAPDGKLLEMNAAGLKMLEANSIEEINEIGLTEFILPGHQNAFRQLHTRVMKGEGGMLQFEVVGRKGTKRWLESHASPIILENDSPLLLAVTRDVTMRVQLEQELKNQNQELTIAKEKAEESDRLKTAFLANMSHEIRTPMNGIMGFANLLQKQNLTPQKEAEYLALIQQSGNRMLNIINDIISISKIESGEISVTLWPTNINEKLEFIRSFFEPEASAKGTQIVVTSSLPVNKATVTTDPEKIYGTLTNLVKNAIKFTHAGTIELGCREKPEEAALEFFVKDTGIGIPHDQLDFIFERFRQVNESSTRNYEGAGLGLSISKAQIEKLGGKMWAESEVGKGSTFYFTIPCQRDLPITQVEVAEPDPSKNKVQNTKGIKIVLAEDDYMSAAFLKAVLNINGNEILHATTGTKAVEIVRNNPDIDVVLMDLSMPELNGYEATSQIRQFNKTAVIIVQSGYAFEENVKQAAEAGSTDFIAKPVDEKELLRMIAKHTRRI